MTKKKMFMPMKDLVLSVVDLVLLIVINIFWMRGMFPPRTYGFGVIDFGLGCALIVIIYYDLIKKSQKKD